MKLLRWVLLALVLIAVPAAAKPAVTVTVSRATDGSWLIDYAFARRSPIWFFTRSGSDLGGKPWRPQSWTVETPGVRLDRAGRYDVLAAGAPLTRVRIRMRPFAHPLLADYTPALAFSDGGLAFYTDHFIVAPLPSLGAVQALPADLSDAKVVQPEITLVFRDAGRRLLLRGKALIGKATYPLGNADTYVYSGAAPVIETPALAGVIDGGLPGWIHAELDEFTPRILSLYTERLGKPVGGRPMALIAWQGADQPGVSLGGSVLDHMVVMQISGKQVLARTPLVLGHMREFIGHESAHFWLGQTVVYERQSESWIMEGGADLLAIRGTRALVPDYDASAYLQREMDECLKLVTAGKALGRAGERGENRAYYACGALLGLAAEGVMRKRDPSADFFAFVHGLLDANRADGKVSTADWLAQLEKVGGDPALSADIRTLLEKGVPDPRAFWAHLFAATGVAFRAEGEGIKLL